MIRFAVPLALLIAVLAAESAAADTLAEALTDAYAGNATIKASRSQQRATDEQLPQAQSGWRPTVNLNGSVYRGHQYFGFGLPGEPSVENITPRQAALVVDQPLYRGGGTDANVDHARAVIAAGADDLASTEQTQLLVAATAYLDLFRDQNVVELNEALIKNLQLNQHDVQATFNAGAATETDTSQASARLAGAVASRLSADAALKTSQAEFREAVGRDPGPLETPALLGQVPASEDEAVAVALAKNPAVASARQQLETAKHAVEIAESGLLPRLDGVIQLSHNDDYLLKGVKQNQAEVGLQASVPLYEAGTIYAQVRAAHEAEQAAQDRVDAAERAVHRQVSVAWDALQAARARQGQFKSQIGANSVALTDTGKEVEAGTRTRLDTLNAQQELFASRVDLVGAEHDALLASFQLEAAEGALHAIGARPQGAGLRSVGACQGGRWQMVGDRPRQPSGQVTPDALSRPEAEHFCFPRLHRHVALFMP